MDQQGTYQEEPGTSISELSPLAPFRKNASEYWTSADVRGLQPGQGLNKCKYNGIISAEQPLLSADDCIRLLVPASPAQPLLVPVRQRSRKAAAHLLQDGCHRRHEAVYRGSAQGVHHRGNFCYRCRTSLCKCLRVQPRTKSGLSGCSHPQGLYLVYHCLKMPYLDL